MFAIFSRRTAAAQAVDEARAKVQEAVDAVGDVDDRFDDTVNELADKMVGAGLGKRQNPFAGYSKHPPSKLVTLPAPGCVHEGARCARCAAAGLVEGDPQLVKATRLRYGTFHECGTCHRPKRSSGR